MKYIIFGFMVQIKYLKINIMKFEKKLQIKLSDDVFIKKEYI
jgi:hypothetical protein